jgi:hypothetical protein
LGQDASLVKIGGQTMIDEAENLGPKASAKVG